MKIDCYIHDSGRPCSYPRNSQPSFQVTSASNFILFLVAKLFGKFSFPQGTEPSTNTPFDGEEQCIDSRIVVKDVCSVNSPSQL